MLVKFGEAYKVSAEDIRPVEAIKDDPVIHARFMKIAANIKKIAPKAEDFLYFIAIMMHASERSLYDEDGNLLKNADGTDVSVSWEKLANGGVKWCCSNPNIRPYCNANKDSFPESELKIAYKKWIGKPLCRDHQSSTVDGVRGIILDTYWDDKHKRIIALCALDKVNYPDLARKVATATCNDVSMGVGVGISVCYECGNPATNEAQYCKHVKNRTAHCEINTQLSPIELSIVVNGADTKAKIMQVLAATEEFKNSLNKNVSSSEELSSIKQEFLTLFARFESLEKEVNDNTLTLKTAENKDEILETFSHNIILAEVSTIKDKMAELEETIKSIANNVETFAKKQATEDLMEKKSYMLGTEEPQTYKKEEGDATRLKDSHMTVDTTLGPVDGIPSKDVEKKKMVARATIEERRAIRQAAVDKAQASIKQAYPKPKEYPYPVDPGAKTRETEFKLNPGNGSDGLFDDDKKVKEQLSRASLKARLVKAAKDGDNRWDISAGDKVVFSATFDELTGKKAALYSAVASNDFARDMMKKIKAVGVEGVTKMFKVAQDPSFEAPMPAEQPMPPADLAVEPAPEAAPGKVEVEQTTVDQLEQAAKDLAEQAGGMAEGAAALGTEEVTPVVGEPEQVVEAALANLQTENPVNATASLATIRSVLNAGLKKAFKKNINKLTAAKEEVELLLSTIKSGSVDASFAQSFAKETLANAEKVLKKSAALQTAFVKYAKGTYALEKRAQAEVEMTKLAEATEVVEKTTTTVEKPEEEEKTSLAERQEARRKMAAAAGFKFSDMLDKAHPGGGTKVTGISGSDTKVEDLKETQKAMLDLVNKEPSAKVKKAAEYLNTLIVAGKVEASQLDEMVKEGMDSEVSSYWKKYYGQVEGGGEFASALLKDYETGKSAAKTAQEAVDYKEKYAKAYDLAYEMADAGMIAKTAVRAEADKIIGYNDTAFESMKRVVAQYKVKLNKTASIQVGVAYDAEPGQKTSSSLYDRYADILSGGSRGSRS